MKKEYFIIILVLGFFSCQKEMPHEVVSSQVDVYVAGVEYNGSIGVGKYWKNGQAVTLTDGTMNAWVPAISVVGSDVYVAGSERNSNGSVSVAKYWKNGQAIALTDGSRIAAANGMAVVGSDVYVAGVELNTFGNSSVAK